MSTKSSKKTAATAAAAAAASAAAAAAAAAVPSSSSSSTSIGNIQTPPSTSTPIAGRRPGSPLSPTRYSRLQEKQDLQNLNDRLACYIEKVHHLETENSRLTREVQSTHENFSRETNNVRTIYDREMADTRKLLDETAKERAKLEIDTKRLWDNNEELKSKLEKKAKDLQVLERSSMKYETLYNDLQSQFSQSQAERKRLADKERELEKEIDRLKDLLGDARKHLEEETLQRIDLENSIQSLKEDVNFKDQVYQQELSESRTRRQVEISEIDGRLAEQYEAKLQQSLQELRDQYEAQMRANRDEIELLYENKIKNLTSQAQRHSGTATMVSEELRQIRSKTENLTSRINELEAINNTLNTRIRDLEDLRENERIRHSETLLAMETDLARMREDMALQLQEYQDLMDIKVALDLEIAAYRKLLESEEARLNITPSQSGNTSVGGRTTPSRHTPLRAAKRKRTLLEESEERSSCDYSVTCSAKGDIEITEADPQGRFVKLTNKGNKEVGLSGWQIIRRAGTLETVFKFHRTAKLDSGVHVMVWSSDIGATHEPPSNIVMKGQKWFVADNMITTLLNNEGEEMATCERKRQQLSTSLSRHREGLGFLSGSEELHHQQDEGAADKCHIM